MNIPADLTRRVQDLAIQIQQIPAPTFAEQQRAEFVLQQMNQCGLKDTLMDEVGNVYGCLPGLSHETFTVISAHTDTVFPFQPGIALPMQIKGDILAGPGIGDNSLGVAGLFGLVWGLEGLGFSLPGDLWVVANTREEGLGDLQGMRAVYQRFGSQAKAYVVVEGMGLGSICHRALGAQRFRITARTTGGHSWTNYGSPSAIHELAALITRLTALDLPAKPRTTLNVGKISGGTSINTIASHASLELDLRSEQAEALDVLVKNVEGIVQQANTPGVEVNAEGIGRRPGGEIPARHPLVQLAVRCLEGLGLPAELEIGSTDANIPLSFGTPAICIGLTKGEGAHTLAENISTIPLNKGLSQLLEISCRVWDINS